MSSNAREKPLFGSTGGAHPLGRFTDQRETYGPLVVEQLVRSLADLRVVVDLGAGSGRDLDIVRRLHPQAKLIAVEGGAEYARSLVGKADEIHVANIERDEFPLADGEADLIIANQVLELAAFPPIICACVRSRLMKASRRFSPNIRRPL